MSRTTRMAWLTALAVVLGVTAARAQPPGGMMPPPGGMPGPGVGVGPGGVGVGVNVGAPNFAGVGGYGAGASALRAPYDVYQPNVVYRPMDKWFYYPYYYFPHSYWPSMGPRWPERPGEHTLPAPAYMAYPPFREPHWRYEWYEPQKYYKGSHFWLDQF